jgi:multicomponent Na+:H+ antiporter subunit G
MTTPVLAWLASFLLLAGALISLLGAIGVVRLPDSYSRMHAASKAGVLGAVLVLSGVAAASNAEVALEVLLGVLVLLASAPLAAHLLSRAAYRAGIRPQCGSLGEALQTERDKD